MRTLTAALLFLLTAAVTGQQPEPKGGKGKAKDDPKARKDLDLIQGNWDIVGLESGGKAEAEKNYKGNAFNFSRDKATLREGNFPPVEFTFSLDPTKTPKAIDLAGKNNVPVLRGIYKLDGDNLTLSLGIGATRPTEFATKAGGDSEVFLLRRNLWERYADKGAGFSVDMPGKPEERRREADGKVTTFHVVRHEAERVSYLVSVTQLPARPDPKRAAELEAARDALLAEIDPKAKPTVESDREFKDGKGGREVTVSLESPGAKAKETVRARLFVAGDRAYGLAVFGPEDAVKAANVLRFWLTFRLVGEKKN